MSCCVEKTARCGHSTRSYTVSIGLKNGQSAMPNAPRHPCNRPGCPTLTDKRFCDTHSRECRRREVRTKGNTTERGYGSDWQKLRNVHIKIFPLCKDPYAVHLGRPVIASHVDHIQSISEAPHRRLDPTNLQSLCANCHNSLKQKEERNRGRGVSNPQNV
jgi:5-methylcytosine-specific restriction protein A